jgi:hypothetical protein
MFHVGYFILGLEYGKSYNFCSTNFEVPWAKYFVVLIVSPQSHAISTTFLDYTIHEFSHMYDNGCLLQVFVASYFVLVVAMLKWT